MADDEVHHVAGFMIKYGDVPMDITSTSSQGRSIQENNVPEDSPFEEMIERNAADNVESHLQGNHINRVSVVLDAANIGRHGEDKGTQRSGDAHVNFDVYKLIAAIKYFERYGLRVISFLPAAMVRRRPRKSDNDKRI